MTIQKLDDGTLLVPQRVEIDGMIGDKMVEVRPGNEEYDMYLGEYEREQALGLS